MRGYTVEETEFGVLVRGAGIPVEEFVALSKAWQKRGLTQMVPGVATALGALFAVASKKNVEPWIAAAKKRAAETAKGDPEIEWLMGPDTGASSLTIFSVLTEMRTLAASRMHVGASVPYDPDDFGRCYRLLKAVPAWRERLSEVAEKYPAWAALVREWSELERLFEEESPKGRCPKLYARMKALLAEIAV